jgi:hypothetical protein
MVNSSGGWNIELERLRGRVDMAYATLNLHNDYIENNAKPTLEELKTFVTELRATTAAEHASSQKMHRQNTFRLNLIGVLAGVSTVIIAIIGILVSIQLAKHSRIIPPDLFGQQYMQQDAQDSQVPDYGVTR